MRNTISRLILSASLAALLGGCAAGPSGYHQPAAGHSEAAYYLRALSGSMYEAARINERNAERIRQWRRDWEPEMDRDADRFREWNRSRSERIRDWTR